MLKIWSALPYSAARPAYCHRRVAAGVPAALCVAPRAAPFDSSALWSVLQDENWSGRSALIVRGDGGRDEFAQALRAVGAKVAFAQAYSRKAPR